MCQKWFAKFHAEDFSLDNAPWSGRPVEVDSDQMETFNREQSMLYHMGSRQHTQNIQIIKVIREDEKYVFYFMEKAIRTFGPTQ